MQATYVKILCRHNKRSPFSSNQRPRGHFKKSHAGQQYLNSGLLLSLAGNNANDNQHHDKKLVSALKSSFCCTGTPDKVWADQGPQFTSKSLQNNGASNTLPHHQGMLKVKSLKKIIRSAWHGRSLAENKLV